MIPPESGERVLAAFRRAVEQSRAYRVVLQEHGIDPSTIVDLDAFTRRCPVLSKRATFARFPIADLVVPDALDEMSGLLTSSGHGGVFTFGVETRGRMAGAAAFVDDALDAAYGVKAKRTLAINCLPMGVGISSDCMAVATVSVREDMAVAIVKAFGEHFEQVLLVCDPLFLPVLLGHGSAERVPWRRYDTKLILGGEFFGESFRNYAGRQLGYSAGELGAGVIRSSMGVGELGLHLLYETPATIALRREAAARPAFAMELLGAAAPVRPAPMLLAHDDARVFVEIDRPEPSGAGALTLTLLDPGAPVPLVRYQTGDMAALVDAGHARAVAQRHGVAVASLPDRIVALHGRRDDRLPSGSGVSVYREALFADDDVASEVTGAYRVEFDGDGPMLHVQLRPGIGVDPSAKDRILDALAPEDRPRDVRLWRYEEFPFGMRLDYERKFPYRGPSA
jgi:phenylacetate-CoA ligase